MVDDPSAKAATWARLALQRYGLTPQHVEVLRHLGNLVIRVETPEVFCLRICSPGADEAQLRTELEWLDALNRETTLHIPRPVPALDGKSFIEVEGRYCVLFGWIDGEPVSRSMSTEVAIVAGRILGTLHRHVRGFRPTVQLGRRYDAEWLIGSQSWWMNAAAAHLGSAHAEFTPLVERCARLMLELGEMPEHFGLIHADLHFGNLLRTKQGYAAIDFDSLGWGYYLFDIAYVEGELADYDDPSLIPALRSGYRRASQSDLDQDALALFGAAVHVGFLEWVFSSPNPNVRAQKLRWVPVALERLRRLADAQP